MTTIFTEDRTCFVCGKTTEVRGIGSTNTMGPPDLDGRPAPMQRSTIDTWVQRCDHCGYCAGNIAKGSSAVSLLVMSEGYQRLLGQPWPESARSFACQALLLEAEGKALDAALALRHAAWMCDDHRKPDEASRFRARSAELLGKALAASPPTNPRALVFFSIVRVDLLRRAGLLAEALEAGRSAGALALSDIEKKVLAYEQRLIEKGDQGGHTVGEATSD